MKQIQKFLLEKKIFHIMVYYKGEIKMTLKDTVEMMGSSDYKEGFRAEYYQLLLRLDALTGMLIKWENNMLDFEPKCSKETLENQVIFMQGYMGILRLRAEIEEMGYDRFDCTKCDESVLCPKKAPFLKKECN